MSILEESSYVRIWLDKGRDEGKKEGKLEGMLEGKLEGMLEGKLEGKLEEARAIILRLGRRRFGEPDSSLLSKLESIEAIERLEEITDRLITAVSWNEAIGET